MDGDSSIYDKLESIILDGSSAPCSIPLECLKKITNNFSDDRLIGEGGFGKVYKGMLRNGNIIAVKKLDHQLSLGVQQRQFENEVYHLMKLKHPNIVRFVGYCYETQNECIEHNGKYIFAEMQQRLLCLEYLPNGSLDMYLSDESSGHDWHTRYKIIRGICYALYYLHEECQCQINASIIHLDLKPANILLDENMVPKVADFGLSRLFEDNKTQTCATFVSGSLGYMAPEYLIGRVVTPKADIHNLGVIIIEIITGSKIHILSFNTDTSRQDFVEHVLKIWRSRLEGASSEIDYKQIKICLEIGLSCVKFDREERPTSREIIERLGRCVSTNCYVNSEEMAQKNKTNVTDTSGTGEEDDNNAASRSPNRSQARGLFRRQLLRAKRFMTRALPCSCVPMMQGRHGSVVSDGWQLRRQSSSSRSMSPRPSLEEFTLAQLKAATNGFSPEAKIGEGRFSTVYRGELPDGREVAIKLGESSGPHARREFQEESAFRSELAFLSRLHHKHLVSLVGYCEEEERLLVYEYMKNGALYDHLHPKPAAAAGAAPSPVASSWKLRIKILLDASRGIEYLHSYAVPPVVHCNIKTSNILLDSSWTARVSDFGLAHLMKSEEEQAAARTEPVGTVGYMDPEYYGLGHLTVKSDVYGFGVVMLMVLTGKPAIFKEAEGKDPVSVVDYCVPSIVSGELRKVLDPRAPAPAVHEAEALELVAYTAVHCVRLEGKYRPAMADIVANLETALALCQGSWD